MQGSCIGIFPEGGSHDNTDLLPLKVRVVFVFVYACVCVCVCVRVYVCVPVVDGPLPACLPGDCNASHSHIALHYPAPCCQVGVASIAFGVLDKFDVNVPIVPVGLNYFRGHRFRGRVVVEFGRVRPPGITCNRAGPAHIHARQPPLPGTPTRNPCPLIHHCHSLTHSPIHPFIHPSLCAYTCACARASRSTSTRR